MACRDVRQRSHLLMLMMLVAAALAHDPAAATPLQSGTEVGPGLRVVDLTADLIRPRQGSAYVAGLSIPAKEGDAIGHLHQSQWVLLEDNVPLGPAHAIHANIEATGGGRYSHWNNSIIFSTSDNSDPRTNGRTYTLVRGIDEAGKRVHFDSPGSMMLLRRGERLWWRHGNEFELFGPRFGAKRPEVNPARPRVDGSTLVFDKAGEYGVRRGEHALRLLVLDDDASRRARQIVSFVAANTTGDNRDMPRTADGATDWPTALKLYYDLLFHSDRCIDVECGPAALLTEMMANAAGLQLRYCGWIGDDPLYPAHTAVEIRNGKSGRWEYFDPHFGLAARNRTDGLTLALSLQGIFAGREDRAFTVLVDKITAPEVADQFHSLREALQLWHDRSRRTSSVLLLRDAIPPTLIADQFGETEFLSASHDLARFRARFYDSSIAEVEGDEPAK